MNLIEQLAAARTALVAAPTKDKAKAQAAVNAALEAAREAVTGVTIADIPQGGGGAWNNGIAVATYTDCYAEGRIETFEGGPEDKREVKGRYIEDENGNKVKLYNAFLRAFPSELISDLTDADLNTVLIDNLTFGIEAVKSGNYTSHVFAAE